MAAGQQKKRLNSASVVSCNTQEQCKLKKKKNLESSRNAFNLRPHISLEWDDAQKRTIAKKEQIGITWREVGPFVGASPEFHKGLADAFAVPQEIYELDNLLGVLSYEVWETLLSESERKFLTQFLPGGIDADEVVEGLLMGENFHFGNPFLTWGTSLCSGNVHPDAVLHRDKCFKATKKAYYAELQKYHTDILETLKRWKDKWTRIKDPEKEIDEKIWRCRIKNAENSLTLHPNESGEHDLEEDHITTADSSSRIANEQLPIINKERTQALKSGERQERKGLGKPKNGTLPVTSSKGKMIANSGKDEKAQKVYVRSGDAAKYMSYIKISRKQHQLVKNIKQSGEGIQSKSLNRVLGDIKSFNVKPYKAFEEEEWKKLHEHWSLVVCKELPAAFEVHERRHLQQQQWRKSLAQELADKKVTRRERSHGAKFSHQMDELKDPEEAVNEQGKSGGETQHRGIVDIQNCKGQNVENIVDPHSSHSPLLQRIPSLNRPHEPELMTLDSEDSSQQISKHESDAPISSKFLESMHPAEEVVEAKVYQASTKDAWHGVEIPDSYYHRNSMAHQYTSSGESSARKQQPVKEKPTRMINLETDIPEQEAGEHFFCRPSDKKTSMQMHDVSPLFSSYTNQDRGQLLPSFLKGQRMLHTYPNGSIDDMQQSGLQFLRPNNLPCENGQFARHLRDQQQLVEDRQMREKELHVNQLMKNMYSNGRHPAQGLFSSGDTQEWTADPVRVAPFQSPVASGMLGNDWLAGDHQARNGWSESEASSSASQCLGGSSSNADGSLFSVLSQCNKLQSHYQNKSMNSKAYPQSRNSITGATSVGGDVFSYTPNQSNYSHMCESTSTSTTTVTTSWMNLPHSNSNPHDSMEKPFLRTWNK